MKESTLRSLLKGAFIASVVSLSTTGCKPQVKRYKDSMYFYAKKLSYDECLAMCNEKFTRMRRNYEKEAYKCRQREVSNDKYRTTCHFRRELRRPLGRRPTSFDVGAPTLEADLGFEEVGCILAEMAAMEAAAVFAFQHLVTELEYHDAPEELLTIAKEGIQEEVEHAEMMRALALSYGVTAQEVTSKPSQIRSKFEMAKENCVEGCIREGYGALTAMWQTEHAEDKAFQAINARIVEEETRHAYLSWKIDEWLRPHLTQDEKQQCQIAQQEAIQELYESAEIEEPEAAMALLGVPSVSEKKILLQEFMTHVLEPNLPWLQPTA